MVNNKKPKLDPDDEVTEPFNLLDPIWFVPKQNKDEIDIDEEELDLTIEDFLREMDEELEKEECECGAHAIRTTHSTWCPSYKKDK